MKRNLSIAAVLVLLTILTYSGLGQLGFVNYDDPDYITGNRIVQKGLTAEGLAWAFGRAHGSQTYWHPVTWVTHMVDCQLFGLNATGHHWVSLGFHAANVVLLFFLLATATGATWTSALVAALFAVHPIQVESVAWITERKNVVSTLFALLTLLAYVRYANSEGVFTGGNRGNRELSPTSFSGKKRYPWYATTVFCFILALMSKPAVVTLPFVMLLLDYWPLRRIVLFDEAGAFRPVKIFESPRVLLEKLPLLLLSIGSCALTIFAHEKLGMLDADTKPPAGLNLGNIVVSYCDYVRKIFWPSDLAVFYPFPTFLSFAAVGAALALLALITIAAFWQLKRRPYLAVGWLWFCGVMVPMSGIVHVGVQAMADRFMYVPMIGILIVVCFGVKDLVSAIAGRTAHSVEGDVIAGRTPHPSPLPVEGRGGRTSADGGVVAGRTAHSGARPVEKGSRSGSRTAGDGDVISDRTPHPSPLPVEGRGSWRAALWTVSVFVLAGCVALSRAQVQFWKDDFSLFEHARQVTKDNYMAYTAVGGVLWKQGAFDRAMTNFDTALKIQPNYADVHLSIGTALLFTNKFAEAAREFEEAVRLKPTLPEARLNLGVTYAFMGNAGAAIASFEEALRTDPNLTKAHLGLGDALLGQSRFGEALDHFRKVIALEPNSAEAMGRLAWLLATHADSRVRNGREAVELAEKACELTQYKKARLLNALGAAQAESGKFELASAIAQKALEVARSTGQTSLVPMTESLLKLYQSGKPYHEEVR